MIRDIQKKLSTDGNELQLAFASAQHVNSPKNLISAFQKTDGIATPTKVKNIAFWIMLILRNDIAK